VTSSVNTSGDGTRYADCCEGCVCIEPHGAAQPIDVERPDPDRLALAEHLIASKSNAHAKYCTGWSSHRTGWWQAIAEEYARLSGEEA